MIRYPKTKKNNYLIFDLLHTMQCNEFAIKMEINNCWFKEKKGWKN